MSKLKFCALKLEWLELQEQNQKSAIQNGADPHFILDSFT